MLPAQWRHVLEHLRWNNPALMAEMVHGSSEINRVPVYNGAHDQVQPRGPEGLALERAITDLATLMEEHGPFQLVGRLSLVEARLATAPECRIRVPFDHKQGAFEAAELTQCPCELGLREAASRLRIVEGATVRVWIEAAR
jgi:hypothetical protein